MKHLILRKQAKGSSRTRRTKDEIEKGSKLLQCPHCPSKLSRRQTLRDHVQKFHPHDHPAVKNAIEEEGRNLQGLSLKNETVTEQQTIYAHLQV